jgi:hypothetical protein
MDVQIRVSGSDNVAEFASLWEWLKAERDLHAAVQPIHHVVRDGELGGALDMLTVALGSGGAGVALARSLTVWLQCRHADVSITVTSSAGDSVQLHAHQVKDPLPLLQQVLRSQDES